MKNNNGGKTIKKKKMKIDDFTKGNFLTAADVKKNADIPLIITVEPKLVDREFDGKKQQKLQIEGEFNKESKTIEMGKLNARKVQDKLGSETNKWIGHQIFFEVYKAKATVGKNAGQLVDALDIKEVK